MADLYEVFEKKTEYAEIKCPICDCMMTSDNLLEHLLYHVALDDPMVAKGHNNKVYTFPLSYIIKTMRRFDIAGGSAYVIFDWLQKPEIVEVLYTLCQNNITLPTKEELHE